MVQRIAAWVMAANAASGGAGNAAAVQLLTQLVQGALQPSAAPVDDVESVSSNDSLQCENQLKNYAIRYRQLTIQQVEEALGVMLKSCKNMKYKISDLGSDITLMCAILKGRHARKEHLCSKSRKRQWNEAKTNFSVGYKARLQQLLQMMLGCTMKQMVRKDSSVGFAACLRIWKKKFAKRLQKTR